jgi:CheY-like chemotaxis protein
VGAFAPRRGIGVRGKAFTMTRVLLVDDDLPFRDMLGQALVLAGFDTAAAATGTEALEQMRMGAIDAVVLDIIMPEMDGIEVLREMRRLNHHLPVVVISGGGRLAATTYLPIAQRLGATAAFEKPFRPGELVDLLRRLLGVPAPAHSLPLA